MKEQDDIYLIDMGRILLRQWRWAVATLVLVLALTCAFVLLARPQWEATAWIQVGEFGPTPAGRDPKLEPFQRVIDRIQTRGFQDAVLGRLGLPLKARTAVLYRKSLNLSPDPYANLIRLSVRADSPEMARRLATATAAYLQDLHGRIGARSAELAQARLQALRGELAAVLALRARWQRQAEAEGDAQGRVLAGVLLSQQDGMVRGLKAEIDDLVVRLTPRYTYATSLPWPIHLPERPVSPNPALAWGLGLLLGIALGVGVAVARDAFGRRRALHRSGPAMLAAKSR